MTALEIAHKILASSRPGPPDQVTLARAVIALHDNAESFAANWKLCEEENDRLRVAIASIEQNIAAFMDGTFAVGDGTAQREIERLRAEAERMRPVVDAAERWADSGSVHDETVMDAVRRYKAVKP